jgi:hypothetical protein
MPIGQAVAQRWCGPSKNQYGCFAVVRVEPTPSKSLPRQEQWLVIEWPDDSHLPTKYNLATLPRQWSRKHLVRVIKERWRTERAYEDLEGELGLDHFEGRSYRGWNHHVTVVLACYAFLVAEQARAFPPRQLRPTRRHPTTRSIARPERHFADSLITVRIAVAIAVMRWLPRCPFCRRAIDSCSTSSAERHRIPPPSSTTHAHAEPSQ